MPAPKRLTQSDYQNIDTFEMGRLPNVGYGAVDNVRAHCISGGATALLSAGIDASQTSFNIDDASRFPAAPFVIQIASERMLVGLKSGNAFSSVARGYDNTIIQPHAANRTVFECRTEYVYLLSPEPVKSIDSVYVDGVLQTTGFSSHTGNAGDEHPGYPGRAVIAFSAAAKIARQINPRANAAIEMDAVISACSHQDIKTGSTCGVPLGSKRNAKVWALFTGSGAITKQSYSATIKNLNASDGAVRLIVRDLASGSVIINKRMLVPGSSTKTVAVGQDGGNWETEFSIVACTGNFEVFNLKKAVSALNPPEEESCDSYAPPVVSSSYNCGGIEKAPSLKPKAKTIAWATYPQTELGIINRQRHIAQVYNPGASKAKAGLISCDASGNCISFTEQTIAAGASDTLELLHAAGAWDAMTKLVLISGELRADNLSKEIYYVSSAISDKPASTSSARLVIGGSITADAKWAEDRTGDYGGLGTLIERPDRVIKHFLVNKMDFALSDVDTASFDAAGASYASAVSGGYKFAFVINDAITPSEFLAKLAFQCRSTINYQNGKWRLNYIPDIAAAAKKIISNTELAGHGSMFVFSRTPVIEIANSITALYRRDYAGSARDYLASVMYEDAASIAKYGGYPLNLEFNAVRDQSTASHVLNHILSERKSPLLTVEFPLFYEHFDLIAGDTIEIDNPLYGGKKFYIESVKRADKFRAVIRAREWA